MVTFSVVLVGTTVVFAVAFMDCVVWVALVTLLTDPVDCVFGTEVGVGVVVEGPAVAATVLLAIVVVVTFGITRTRMVIADIFSANIVVFAFVDSFFTDFLSPVDIVIVVGVAGLGFKVVNGDCVARFFSSCAPLTVPAVKAALIFACVCIRCCAEKKRFMTGNISSTSPLPLIRIITI